jgi:hypothetical protein
MNRFAIVLFQICFLAALAVPAAAEDRLVWLETRTEHCVFIYQRKDEAAVRELVGFAEEVYADVSTYLDSRPREVRAVVLGSVDEANGEYSAPPHHLELYVRAPIAPWLGARGISWLRLLFTHELTHFCDMDADYGFFYVLSLILGEGVKSGDSALLPAWTYEGLAVLLETELTSGGRGRNPFFLMYAKAFLADDAPLTLGHLEYQNAFPPPERYYVFGYLFLDFLKRNYGSDVYRKIRRRFLDFPLFGPWEAIRAVTGKHQDVLWEEMRADWKTRLAVDSPRNEGEAVSPPGFGDYFCPAATDAGWYLYRQKPDRPPAVVWYEPRTREERVLFEEYLTDERSFTATRDGRKIVYAATVSSGSGAARWRVTSDLFLAEIAGTGERRPRLVRQARITANGHLWHPALSADGSRLAAVQGAGEYSRLVLVDQASGRASVLYAEDGVQVYNPAFSPDGKLIAFALNRRGRQDVYLIPADAPALPADGDEASLVDVNLDRARPLLGNDEAGDYFPRFVDDRTVLFTSDREGYLALYEAAVDRKELVRVGTDRIAAFDGMMDAEGLVYGSYRSTGYVLRRTAKAGLERTVLAPSADIPPLPPLPRPAIDSRPFIDWPGFEFWLPYGYYLIDQNVVQLAFGVYALFGSYLGTNGIDVSLLYFPTYNQPEAAFNFNTELGPLNLYYTLKHSFAALGPSGSVFYREDVGQNLSFELPLVDWYAASGGDYLSASLGVSHDFIMDSSSPFPFLNGFSPSTIPNGNFLSADLGLFFSHSKYGGAAAFYPPWSVVNAFDVLAPIPVLDETRVGFVLVDRFYCTLPGLWNLSAVRLGLKADYQTDEVRGYPWVGPRGNLPETPQAQPGRAVFILDYLATLVYADAPLFGGLHFDGLGAGLHWEVPFDWDVLSPAFAFDRYFYVGAEITVELGLGKFSLPIGLGVTMRLDWALSEPIDINDFGFYYFLSFNSFWSGAREKPPLNRKFR